MFLFASTKVVQKLQVFVLFFHFLIDRRDITVKIDPIYCGHELLYILPICNVILFLIKTQMATR